MQLRLWDKPNDGDASESRQRITDHQDLLTFIYAGNATITVKSLKTQERFTYRVKVPSPSKDGEKEGPVGWFVGVLTGADNTNDYTYLGHIFRNTRDYVPGRKSHISPGAPSSIAWQWFYGAVVQGTSLHPDKCEVWHEGRCGACNRKLTVPESISTGLGPECAKSHGIRYKAA